MYYYSLLSAAPSEESHWRCLSLVLAVLARNSVLSATGAFTLPEPNLAQGPSRCIVLNSCLLEANPSVQGL